MAKDEKAEDGAAAAYRAVGLDRSCRREEVQRIEGDPEDDETDDLFAVTVRWTGRTSRPRSR